jgi:hypothetical protein
MQTHAAHLVAKLELAAPLAGRARLFGGHCACSLRSSSQ